MIATTPSKSDGHPGITPRNGQAIPPAGAAPLNAVSDGAPAPQAEAPSPAEPAVNGRDGNGRFAAGNQCAKGNPHARRMAQLRSALLEIATPERLRSLGEKLYQAALTGNLEAARLWLSYCVGRPVAVVNPDTLDLDEYRLLDANPTAAQILRLIFDSVPAALGAAFAERCLPVDLESARGKIVPRDKDARRSLELEIADERMARVGRK
jgi:hypothetical protein